MAEALGGFDFIVEWEGTMVWLAEGGWLRFRCEVNE